MIPEHCEVPVNETFHVQTDDELTEKKLKQIEADDQSIQTILLGLPEDIYAVVDKNGTKKYNEVNTTTTTTTTTTPVTNAQLKALIDQGVADTLAARDADRSRNDEDSHDSETGTEGVTELTKRFERMETVFHISNYTVENQIKFATCTLLGSALTWWNSHVKTVGPDVAYVMTWTNLKKKMTDKYFPRGEIKLEVKLWNLKVKGTDVIKRNIDGLPAMIHRSEMTSKPKTMHDVIEFTTELMDKKVSTFAERQAKNKRKFEDTSKNNKNQPQNKKQNTDRAYTAGSGEKKPYGGSKPLCSKCNYHHDGPCQKPTCFECGAHGHFKRECLKLKNNNRGNPARNSNAPAKVYAMGHAGTNPDSNILPSKQSLCFYLI
nr:hypothetical protein [Tanacetum cinerariifolium]